MEDNNAFDFNQFNDEELMDLFLDVLETGRIELKTAYVKNEDSDIITHEVMVLKCGDLVTSSTPEQLEMPLMLAPTASTGATIN